ncbi:MAG: hypothetical protein IH969_03325 [Candidatus Krumholzibacteriota bacterium]|nr:hypothetical protein [Candidatus Krumholzibacteriota bacterium]
MNEYTSASDLVTATEKPVECSSGRRYQIRKIELIELVALGVIPMPDDAEATEVTTARPGGPKHEDNVALAYEYARGLVTLGVVSVVVKHDDMEADPEKNEIRYRNIPITDRAELVREIEAFSDLRFLSAAEDALREAEQVSGSSEEHAEATGEEDAAGAEQVL